MAPCPSVYWQAGNASDSDPSNATLLWLSGQLPGVNMKILPAPSYYINQINIFGQKGNKVNLEPSRRPPLPVCYRMEAQLIDFRVQTVGYL
jgi:hypothetical protein